MIKRRQLIALLISYGISSLLPATAAQPVAGIRIEKLNYFQIKVSDIDKSLAFYQQLLGMPVQSRSADRIFTDPYGILMQLQDTTYCGGGYLGNECLKQGDTQLLTLW